MVQRTHHIIPRDSFSRFVLFSILFHALVVLFLFVQNLLPHKAPIDFQMAVKVDIVDLPDKASPEPEQIHQPMPPPIAETKATEPPPAPEPVKQQKETLKEKNTDKEAINLDKTKSKQKAALEKLKQLSAIEKIQNELTEKKQKKKPIKGAVLNNTGDLKGFARIEFENYLSLVDKHIHQFWAMPNYLRGKKYVTEVLIFFDKRGHLLSKKILKSSGNSTYDDVAMTAVQKSSPVPPPPEQFVRLSTNQGLVFRFSE